MVLAQKEKVYNSTLTALRSGLSRFNDEMLIYKFTVDLLGKITHLSWVGIWFFNPVTKEFYLGYNIGKTSNKTVLRLDQLSFTSTTKVVIVNDIEQEKEPGIAPQVASEMKILLKKNQKILGMITVGSDRKDIFDETDKNYLAEIAETVVERIQYR